MLRISILILYFHSVLGTLTLLVTKEENGMNTSIVNNIGVCRGSSFVLTCSVWHRGDSDNHTWWIKSNKNLSQHELHFNRVRLKDQGEYVCLSYIFRIKKMVELHVLPKVIPRHVKQQVHDWIYPIRHVRSNSDSSSAESQKKQSKLGTNSDYIEFWAVAFVIVIVGLGIFFLYYLLKRYWWKANSRGRLRQECHRVRPATRDETSLSEPNCDLPPSYNEHDLPPSYYEAVINVCNHN